MLAHEPALFLMFQHSFVGRLCCPFLSHIYITGVLLSCKIVPIGTHKTVRNMRLTFKQATKKKSYFVGCLKIAYFEFPADSPRATPEYWYVSNFIFVIFREQPNFKKRNYTNLIAQVYSDRCSEYCFNFFENVDWWQKSLNSDQPLPFGHANYA